MNILGSFLRFPSAFVYRPSSCNRSPHTLFSYCLPKQSQYDTAQMKRKRMLPAERNPIIIKMHSEGCPIPEIASHYGVSTWLIDNILRDKRRRDLFESRGRDLRHNIQTANHPALKMPMDDLFVALQFPIHIGKRLKEHFTSKGIQELSLIDFMDFLIPNSVKITSPYDSIPAYRAKHVGRKTYAYMITGMNLVEDELGVAFKDEWTRRKKRLKECMIANNYSDSYLTSGKNPAL